MIGRTHSISQAHAVEFHRLCSLLCAHPCGLPLCSAVQRRFRSVQEHSERSPSHKVCLRARTARMASGGVRQDRSVFPLGRSRRMQ